MAVSQILKSKGAAIVSAGASDKLDTVAKKLAEHRIGSVLVLDGGGGILGIVSERDIVRALAADGAAALQRKASEVMTSQVRTCKPGDTEAELMALMTTHRIRHLPVVERGKLLGMISIGDVVKFRIEAIEHEADDLKAYIASAG
jgi:CBS domain-containing protein